MPNNFRKHMAVGVEIVLCSKHTCGKIKVHPVHLQCRNFWKNYTDLPKSDRPKLFMTKNTYIPWKTSQNPQLNEILPTMRAWRTHGNIASSVTFCQVNDSCMWPIIFSLQIDSITITILQASWRKHVIDIGKYLVPAAMASIKSMYHGSICLILFAWETVRLQVFLVRCVLGQLLGKHKKPQRNTTKKLCETRKNRSVIHVSEEINLEATTAKKEILGCRHSYLLSRCKEKNYSAELSSCVMSSKRSRTWKSSNWTKRIAWQVVPRFDKNFELTSFFFWMLHGSTSPLSGRSPFCELQKR